MAQCAIFDDFDEETVTPNGYALDAPPAHPPLTEPVNCSDLRTEGLLVLRFKARLTN